MSRELEKKLYSFEEKNIIQTDLQLEGNEEFDNSFASLSNDNVIQTDSSLKKTRKRVSEKMPPIFSKKAQMIKDGNYMYYDSKKKKMVKSKKSASWFYMSPLIKALNRLDSALDKKISLKDYDAIQKNYIDVFHSCEKYLEKRKNPRSDEGKARYQMISDFYDSIKEESWRFDGRVQEIKKKPELANSYDKWMDFLKEVRTLSLENGKDGVTITKGGGGTSDLYIVDVNGEKKYFKENENVPPKDWEHVITPEIERLSKDPNSSRRLSIVTGIRDLFTGKDISAINSVLRNKKDIKDEEERWSSFNEEFEGGKYDNSIKEAFDEFIKIRKDITNLETTLNDLKEKDSEKNSEEIKKLQLEINRLKREEEASDYNYFINTMTRVRKDLLMHSLCTKTAKIKEGSNISRRNAATSRLANMLGIGDLIVGSKVTNITIDGKNMTGIMMDEAKGASYLQYSRNLKEGEKMQYSGDAFRKLLNLQIFDIICGQIDRNAGNYMTTITDVGNGVKEIDSIVGIDNDICFGTLKHADIEDKGREGYHKIRNFATNDMLFVPHIDLTFARSVLALNPAIACYMLSDILTKKEQSAFSDRLVSVQQALRRFMLIANSSRKSSKSKMFIPSKDKEAWANAADKYAKNCKTTMQKMYDDGVKEAKKKKPVLTEEDLDAIEDHARKYVKAMVQTSTYFSVSILVDPIKIDRHSDK